MTLTLDTTAAADGQDAARSDADASVKPTQTPAAIEALVRENLALVGHIVRESTTGLPAHVSRDDLTSAGMVALALSAQGYDRVARRALRPLRRDPHPRRADRRAAHDGLGQPRASAARPAS